MATDGGERTVALRPDPDGVPDLAVAAVDMGAGAPGPTATQPVSIPGLDPHWVEVIRRCMARYPQDRFPSVAAVDRALAGEFVASATGTDAFPAPSAVSLTVPTAAAAPEPKRRRQMLLLAAVSLVLVLAVGQAVVRVRHALESPLGEPGAVRRAVAVVPFRNLAQRAEFEWLSVALAEMVASELRAGQGLRTVAGDDVARARLDLGLA